MAYATLPEVKEFLGIPDDQTSDDDLLESMIDQAKVSIDDYFLRTFEADEDSTRYFDAIKDVSGRRLLLDRDLCQITSVVNGNGETVLSTKYVTVPVNETPYYALDLRFSSGLNWEWEEDHEAAISVTGRWAYSLTAPSHVQYLCKYLVSVMYRGKDNVPQTGSSRSVASSMEILAGDLPSNIRLIMSYIPRRAVI